MSQSYKEGFDYMLRGLDYEDKIRNILLDTKNINEWNNSFETCPKEFSSIMNAYGIERNILAIKNKTNSIVGNSKTDVCVEITTANKKIQVNLSCKCSNKNRTTLCIHSVKTLKSILPFDNDFEEALIAFQKIGNVNVFKRKYPDKYNYIKANFYKYKISFMELLIWGKNLYEGNAVANGILYYNVKAEIVKVWDKKDFINIQNKIKNDFGTPFMWHYPSKRKGKKIKFEVKFI